MIGRTLLMTGLWSLLALFSTVAQAAPESDACPRTSERRAWSAACFEGVEDDRQVKPQYRKNLAFGDSGIVAIVIAAPAELVAVNQRGKLIKPSKARLAEFFFEASEGPIARFFYADADKAGVYKCGFYRRGRQFEVLVPPVYDQCDDMRDGTALVCIGCKNYCESGDCHESDFIGGTGLSIDASNRVIKRYQLPTLPLCGRNGAKPAGDPTCRKWAKYIEITDH